METSTVKNALIDNPDREIERINGIWCPLGRSDAWRKYWARAVDMEYAVERCLRHRLAVQAGGNIGAWPLWLGKRFKEVMTFEPEDMNFRCLVQNIAKHDNIEPYEYALGARSEMLDLRIAGTMGGHHLSNRPGTTRVTTIDSFGLRGLDYIMLDIEGWEYEAIQGAQDTIREYHPVIQIEDRGHGEKKGNGSTLADILDSLPGYKIIKRVHRDVVLEYRA